MILARKLVEISRIRLRFPTFLLVMSIGVSFYVQLSNAAVDAAESSPHWNKSACDSCHDSPAPTDSSDVRSKNHGEICADCHDDSAQTTCPHPTNFPERDSAQITLPESYRAAMVDGRTVCTTCHSTKLQCTGGRREQYQNPAFLRSGPARPGQACFACHDTERYQKMNPHTFDATAHSQNCLFCHTDMPGAADVTQPGTRLSGNLQCTGCHKVLPHPLSAPGTSSDTWTHLAVPRLDMVAQMNAVRDQTGIVLPLDPDDGAINCATCHNVHDPELPGYPLQSDDGTANKLRMLDICKACHEK